MGIMKDTAGVIFDLDGTLLDSNNIWEQIDRELLARRGISVSDDFLKILASHSYEEAYNQMQLVGVTDSYETILNEFNEMALFEYQNNVVLKDEAKTYLEKLKEDGVKLAIATASPKELYEPVLTKYGILNLFDNITTTFDVGKTKDFPDIYLTAAAKIGVSPANCVVFEDLKKGIETAKAAGFKTCMVYDRYSQLDFFRMRGIADHYIYSFADLLKV
ncbi:MAG: HAD family phosphatase [Ruminococcus sp.]|jgi:HAD superfamily hydrolase (TIGR01509 family)|nr:HAD family phosphatase [Ruminococcus sp.]